MAERRVALVTGAARGIGAATARRLSADGFAVVALDAWAPPWRVLAPHLARAEWRGEVRRGYFVEGLSGVQYALPGAADALAGVRP